MMSMDTIHVHVEEGGEQGKVEGNIALGINESWCHVKPPLH
jgi:hypothetical protein